eukprot:PhM_4_TR15634/c2_g2_i1/m.64558
MPPKTSTKKSPARNDTHKTTTTPSKSPAPAVASPEPVHHPATNNHHTAAPHTASKSLSPGLNKHSKTTPTKLKSTTPDSHKHTDMLAALDAARKSNPSNLCAKHMSRELFMSYP